MAIRCLIVDDEPIARKLIADYLDQDNDFEIAGECGNGLDAIRMILAEKPDLLFLDIQMPEMNGFEVVQNINPDLLPYIIFVTAYDQYAIKAFEINALDYLLKPFDDERFLNSVSRAKKTILANSDINEKLSSLLDGYKPENRFLKKLLIKSGGRILLLKMEEITWIEAASDYVKVYAGKESHLIRETMSSIIRKLDPDIFLRIHRSYIINVDYLKELQPWDKNNYLVVLQDGTELKLSKNYKEKVFAHFNSE